jgi:hypothetical protein
VSETAAKTPRAWPFGAASAGACALGVLFALLLREPARQAAVYGAAAASLGALCGFSALAASVDRGVNGLLAGFTIGFLCRAVLVAVGLFASGVRGSLALVYTAAFFALYAATQLIEVLFVHASSRGQGATP